jgi:hypothetical protein
VTVRAVFADVGEHGLQVALGAVNFFVHAAKGISRGVVIEFGNGADRGPTCVCVAILARNGERAMRTPARLPLRRSLRGEDRHRGE